MDTNSPFFFFERASPGWLRWGTESERYITRSDVERIVAANPGCELTDPVVADFLARARSGLLKARRGRPQAYPALRRLLWLAHEDVSKRRLEIRAERRKPGYQRQRTDLSPVEAAAKEFARFYGFNDYRQLLNAISKWRKESQLL